MPSYPGVNVVGPELPMFQPQPSSVQQELQALQRGLVPDHSAILSQLSQRVFVPPPMSGPGVGYPSRGIEPTPHPGSDGHGILASAQNVPSSDRSPYAPGQAPSQPQAQPTSGSPVAPPAPLPQIVDRKTRETDDYEQSKHELLKRRLQRRKERDALTASTQSDRQNRLVQGARENDEGNQAQMRTARKTNPAAFEDDPDQPGRIRGKSRPILSEQYAGEEDNTMGPHRLDRVPLQPQPYNASQPSPSSAPPPSLSAHPMDSPQSFQEKYATITQMKSMDLDPSSPKDRMEYDRLKHLRGVH